MSPALTEISGSYSALGLGETSMYAYPSVAQQFAGVANSSGKGTKATLNIMMPPNPSIVSTAGPQPYTTGNMSSMLSKSFSNGCYGMNLGVNGVNVWWQNYNGGGSDILRISPTCGNVADPSVATTDPNPGFTTKKPPHTPTASQTGGSVYMANQNCGPGGFVTGMWVTQSFMSVGGPQSTNLHLGCATGDQMKDAFAKAQLLVEDPICTGKQPGSLTLQQIQSGAGQGGEMETRLNACAAHARTLCSESNPPMPYCSCLTATPLQPGIPVECISNNECSSLKYASMWVNPATLIDPCKGGTFNICNALNELTSAQISLYNDKITLNCGQQFSKCATCKTGVGQCVSLTDSTVCRPAGSDGSCGSGWTRCPSAPSPTPPVTPPGGTPTKPPSTPPATPPATTQPWWGIFTNSSPLVVAGQNIGTIGHWIIGGVAAAGVILLLLIVYFIYQYL